MPTDSSETAYAHRRVFVRFASLAVPQSCSCFRKGLSMGRKLDACLSAINEVILGKEAQVRLAMTCLIGGGHLLIEDLPGMGKTTLSHALAKILGLSYQRIQFTSDLLPGDILGTSVFDRDSGQFTFHPGPIFAELVLADEINRATPKSQSALLEAMEEGQVSIEGATRLLPDPFFVIATQNPFSSGGTFALPESQLDRFLMRISMGYPARAAEKALLLGESRRELLPRLQPILDHALLGQLQAQARQVRASDALVDYVLRLVDATRSQAQFAYGLSPRASLAILAAARAWAMLLGRDYVIPEDVQAVLPSVVGHRLRERSDPTGHGGGALVQWLLREVPVL
ncbi:putative MoxR protein [Pseudomonas syringae pv. actinidiae]|nr:putative MoxR protein [Pseudomonas syringae pv. actinidiae]